MYSEFNLVYVFLINIVINLYIPRESLRYHINQWLTGTEKELVFRPQNISRRAQLRSYLFDFLLPALAMTMS
jgi:hypothetical protein